jgi:hypothetical protein
MIDLTAVELAAQIVDGLSFWHPTILGWSRCGGYCKTLQEQLQSEVVFRWKSHKVDTLQAAHSGFRAWQT